MPPQVRTRGASQSGQCFPDQSNLASLESAFAWKGFGRGRGGGGEWEARQVSSSARLPSVSTGRALLVFSPLSWVFATVEARIFPFYGLPASRLLLTLGWWRGTFALRSLRVASGPKAAFRLALERAIHPYLVFYWAVGREV